MCPPCDEQIAAVLHGHVLAGVETLVATTMLQMDAEGATKFKLKAKDCIFHASSRMLHTGSVPFLRHGCKHMPTFVASCQARNRQPSRVMHLICVATTCRAIIARSTEGEHLNPSQSASLPDPPLGRVEAREIDEGSTDEERTGSRGGVRSTGADLWAMAHRATCRRKKSMSECKLAGFTMSVVDRSS